MVGKKRLGSVTSRPAGKKIKVGAARVKDDPDAVAAGSSQQSPKTGVESVKHKFIKLLSERDHKNGISSKVVEAKFNSPEEKNFLVQVINELSSQNRLQMSTSQNNQLHYTLVDNEVAQKYQGLDVSAKMVLQVIEKAGNQGIWTRDVRMQTNIHDQKLKKIFKQLCDRCLIKPVRSVSNKKKLYYMLYDLTASNELTGGVWYSGLDFDHEFIISLRTFVMHCVNRVHKGQGVTLAEVKSKMAEAKVSKVELSMDEVKQLVKTLVYDCHIEEVIDEVNGGPSKFVATRRMSTMCDFKCWDILSPDFHFRAIEFEDGVKLGPHEPHHQSA